MAISAIKKDSEDYNSIAISYHEAGHTLIALYNLIEVISVNMSPKLEEGITSYNTYVPELVFDEELAKVFIILDLQLGYAGLVSEKIYYTYICGKTVFPARLAKGAADDNLECQKMIIKYNLAPPGKQRTALKKKIKKDVYQILTEYWGDLRLIAHALYKHKRLNYKQLKNILYKSENKEFWKSRFKKIEMIHSKPVEEKIVKDIILKDKLLIIE